MKRINFLVSVLAVFIAMLPLVSWTQYRGIRGDANGDGRVNINDVTTVINYLLSGDGSSIDLSAADLDGNGTVKINDVTELINLLLNGLHSTEIKRFEVNGVKFTMVRVEPGTFLMGATPEQGGDTTAAGSGNYYAIHAHYVTLTKPFYIGQTEVTQELWEAVMGNNPSAYISPQNPVNMVGDYWCNMFFMYLKDITGLQFRLPTEAEWEFAARGGNYSGGYRYAGSDNLDEVAWYRDNTGGNTLRPVGQKKPNELGLYDMSGNADELVQDFFQSYSFASQTDPCNLTNNGLSIMRGGSCSDLADGCRVSVRHRLNTGMYGAQMTLRMVLDAE